MTASKMSVNVDNVGAGAAFDAGADRIREKFFQGIHDAKKALFTTCVSSGCKGLPSQLTRNKPHKGDINFPL